MLTGEGRRGVVLVAIVGRWFVLVLELVGFGFRWCDFFFFFNDTATTEIYTLSLHDALPILPTSKSGIARALSSCLWTDPEASLA